MKGAVAAGHPVTAQAGARILEAGGNAVDACVAAGFVSWVVESPLTGPGAGGFMLVHRASDRSDRLLDFFVALPGRGLEGDAAAIDAGYLTRRRRVRQRVEHGEHRAAVSGFGEPLQRGIERQDQVAAAHLEGTAKRGVYRGHAIIFECRRPF